MSARWTIFLRTVVIGCCVVAFTAVAQDEHHDDGQQRQADQNAGRTGQQPQNREQQGQQSRPQGTQQSGQYQQRTQQSGQQYQQPSQQSGQQYQQRTQQNGQQYQQPNQQNGQQYQQHGEQNRQPSQQNGQQYQQRTQQNQQQYQQRGNQQQYQQRGDQHGQQQYTRDSNRGDQQYRSGNRPQQWGRPPAHRPTFTFRSNDRDVLRHYYGSRLSGIDRAHRPVFRMGGYLPYEDLGYFSPVPPGAWGSLPPIPYGYAAGYWDGYVVVYDPETGYILYVTDLM